MAEDPSNPNDEIISIETEAVVQPKDEPEPPHKPIVKMNDPRNYKLCSCYCSLVGLDDIVCKRCTLFNRKNYKRLEEKYFGKKYYEYIQDFKITDSIVICFYLANEVEPLLAPILVNYEMTAVNVVRYLAAMHNIEDYYRYTISIFYSEFKAEREVSDYESVWLLRRQNEDLNYYFPMFFMKDPERYDYFEHKEKYFIQHDAVRSLRKEMVPTQDPWLIAIGDDTYLHFDQINEPKEEEEEPENEDPPQPKVAESSSSATPKTSSTSASTSSGDYPGGSIEPLISPPQSASNLPRPLTADEIRYFCTERFGDPIFCGIVWVLDGISVLPCAAIRSYKRKNPGFKFNWMARNLLLRDQTLFFIDSHERMLEYYFMEKKTFYLTFRNIPIRGEHNGITLVGHVQNFEFFTNTQCQYYYDAPNHGGIIVRDIYSTDIKYLFVPEPPRAGDYIKFENTQPSVHYVGHKLWVAALKIAKHPKKLKMGFEMFQRNKLKYQLVQELESYHVPMDFSSGRGVIINTSSKEEGLLKLPGNEPRFVNFFPYTPNLDQKRLALEPYYYDNITKSDAEKMLKSKNIEGCFLLRRALTRNNCVTLSYLFEKRVYHRILKAVPYCEPVTDTKITLVTLDYDTAFYNIKNLVDYYKLNKGRKLMCILSISLDDQVKLDKIKDKKSQEIPCPVEQESNAYVFPLDKTPRRLVRFYPVSRSTKPVKINGKMYYPLEELTDEQKAALKKAKESKAKSKNLLNFFRRDKPQTTTIPEIFQPSSSQSIELAGPSTSSQSSGPSTVAGPSTSSQPLGPSKLQQGPSEP